MPLENPGYDFVCSRGYKIDVKSSTRSTRYPNTWTFHINKNTTADYFLCIAFDNRADLNPEHMWLIPGNIINDRSAVRISDGALAEWEAYHLAEKLDEVKLCCNTLKGMP